MGLRIQVTLSDAALNFIDERRGSIGRGSYVRRLCDAVAVTASLRPPVSADMDLADEIREMFDDYIDSERPDYGCVPVRHPRREPDYD